MKIFFKKRFTGRLSVFALGPFIMKIAVLVSGGVDSSVALKLLKEEGHDVTAFYLKIWLADELSFLSECPWEEDLSFVRAVCEQEKVPLEIVPFQKEYWDKVVGYTIAEAKEGRTPNPDMLCNARIKFGAFYDYIETMAKARPGHNAQAGQAFDHEFDKVATGHYAQTEEQDNGITLLKTSPDPVKDQTYFLSQLSQRQIARAVFPIGKYQKEQIRSLAQDFKLANAGRKDSQGICFLGKIPFDEFLQYHLGKKTGRLIESESGRVLGEHNGYWYFTVGQRRGLRLSGGPWYVTGKDPQSNEVFISRAERPAVAPEKFQVGRLNWISGQAPQKSELKVKVRHGARYYEANIQWLDDSTMEVRLKDNDMGLAPGQFAVFYDEPYCLGGGVIL